MGANNQIVLWVLNRIAHQGIRSQGAGLKNLSIINSESFPIYSRDTSRLNYGNRTGHHMACLRWGIIRCLFEVVHNLQHAHCENACELWFCCAGLKTGGIEVLPLRYIILRNTSDLVAKHTDEWRVCRFNRHRILLYHIDWILHSAGLVTISLLWVTVCDQLCPSLVRTFHMGQRSGPCWT